MTMSRRAERRLVDAYVDEVGRAAIDLYGGRVVRLFKGDFSKKTEYGEDPRQVAETRPGRQERVARRVT